MRLKDTKTVKKMIDRMNTSGGTSDYNDLDNKPTINGVELSGNKTTADLGIEETILLTGDEDWLQGGTFDITDAQEVDKLERIVTLLHEGKYPNIGLDFTGLYVMLPTSFYSIDVDEEDPNHIVATNISSVSFISVLSALAGINIHLSCGYSYEGEEEVEVRSWSITISNL